MYKVLLVDDEPYVIEGLKVMVDWEKHGFSICGEAMNGEDALEIIKEINPHLVICDIKMPIMDGLQMVKYASQISYIRSIFIILSGYSDFSYAQTAMRYNVFDYIMKPLDDEVLDELIKRTTIKLREKENVEERTNHQLEFLAYNSIHRIIKGVAKESVLKRADFILEIGKAEKLQCLIIEIEDGRHWSVFGEESVLANKKEQIRIFVEESLPDTRLKLRIFEDEADHICIIMGDEFESLDQIKDYSLNLREQIFNRTHSSISIGISGRAIGLESFGELYRQALKAIGIKFYLPNKSLIIYDEIKNINIDYEISDIKYSQLLDEIKKCNFEAITSCLKDLFHWFSIKYKAPETIKAFIKNVEAETLQIIHSIDGDLQTYSDRIISFNKFMDTANIVTLNQAFNELCLYIAEYIHVLSQQIENDPLVKIKEYIKQHYNTDIKLKTMAQKFYISPVYLGQLFRKSTGIQFNEYVHRVRVEEAKKLLKRTDMKISDIARAVGYTDTDYFVDKFKSLTSLPPSLYKKSV